MVEFLYQCEVCSAISFFFNSLKDFTKTWI